MPKAHGRTGRIGSALRDHGRVWRLVMTNEIRSSTSSWSRKKWLLLAGIAAFGWGSSAALAQAPPAPDGVPQAPMAAPIDRTQAATSGAAQATTVYTMEDLSYLLGPIALYPDPLLALILSASTFPVQIVEADRWIAANSTAVARRDFTQVDSMPWDGSVQALTRFPDEIKLLAEHLDWSQSLGMAFSLQPADVTAAVQMLRAKAESVGNLKSTPEQVVTVQEDGGSRVIYIAPANPERIYVPRYDSSSVFDTLLPGAVVFATGVIVGSAWNNRWGWNNRRWNQVWINQPVWHAPPSNWNPRPDRPGAGRPPAAWRPDRPGNRPDRPNLRPDRPGVRPDRPNLRPDAPGMRPDRPGANRPDRPGANRPDRPSANRPGANRPDQPGVNRPGVNRPGANRPDRPGANRPDRPGANRPGNVQRPQNIRPQPGARPQQQRARPQARPQQPQRARPAQQRARPQARPQQQRARPQQRPTRNR